MQCARLPYSDFRLLNASELNADEIINTPDDAEEDYILEID